LGFVHFFLKGTPREVTEEIHRPRDTAASWDWTFGRHSSIFVSWTLSGWYDLEETVTLERYIFFAVVVVVCGVVGGLIGRRRNNVVAGVLFGLLLGPIGWLLVAGTRWLDKLPGKKV
jgi:hypothetical protein